MSQEHSNAEFTPADLDKSKNETEQIRTQLENAENDAYSLACACERTLMMRRIMGGLLVSAPFFSCIAMATQQTVPRRSPMFMPLVALVSSVFGLAGVSMLREMEPIIREKQRATQLAAHRPKNELSISW